MCALSRSIILHKSLVEKVETISFEPILVQDGQPSGMVDVRMSQQDKIDQIVRNGNILIDIDVLSLFHPAVNENVFSACLQIMAASSDLMVCAYKSKSHIQKPPFLQVIS